MRRLNTTTSGVPFNSGSVELVWRKGNIVAGYNPNEVRKDTCGAWIKRADYGKTGSQYGWEVDHIQPVSMGGSDYLSNLQPLQWKNNRHKSDNYPYWNCAV